MECESEAYGFKKCVYTYSIVQLCCIDMGGGGWIVPEGPESRHSSKLHKKKQCASDFTRLIYFLLYFYHLPSIFPSLCSLFLSFFLSTSQDCATMQFCANKLDKKDFFGRSDPFMVFYRSNDGTWVSCLSHSDEQAGKCASFCIEINV